MSSDQIIFWCIVALAPIATIIALIGILTGPRIISKLMLRYLMKRRIAWVSLIAVMLCTAMVLIVISVMGGWLRMFREMNHALVGDLIVHRDSLDGFERYQEMIDQIKAIPEVKEATPDIRTYGFAEIGYVGMANPVQTPVEAMGLDIKQIGQVNGFIDSLYLQKKVLEQRAKSTKDPDYAQSFAAKAASFPSWQKPLPDDVYRGQFPESKSDPAKWGGIIVGSGVIGFRPDTERSDDLYTVHVKLTVLKPSGGSAGISLGDKTSTNNYWMIDDSHTNVYQVDQNRVYLPFEVLQKEMEMDASTSTDANTGQTITEPARCSEILISVKDGVDPYEVKPKIAKIVADIAQKYSLHYDSSSEVGELKVETWDERQQDILNAVEHEKSLLVVLFAIISIVAIFLIFCIFFMIVMEKTRDIGIVKSVGARGSSVAGIFLGYGLSIGLVGGGAGLLLAYLVVHKINEIHAWMGRRLGIEIWNAKTYLFDKIPDKMDPHDVLIIVSIAILSSVLGAVLPAIRAARMNPVESLRWE